MQRALLWQIIIAFESLSDGGKAWNVYGTNEDGTRVKFACVDKRHAECFAKALEDCVVWIETE
jgi:hypothetical protein